MESSRTAVRDALTAAANPSGGWPYTAGKSSRIEPTCWALLALAETMDGDASAWQRVAAPHLAWLEKTQRGDGLVVDVLGAPPNFTANGLAACTLAHLRPAPPTGAPDSARLFDALVSVKGVSVDAPDPRQDNRLQGWPWMPDTFSWLEPTCWCVLALKKSGVRSAPATARIQEAEKLILNRTCESGGWNFGNASVIGQDLRPYVPTTALALIALQNRRDAAEVTRSAAWLHDARLREPSAMALSLTAIWLRLSGADADDVEARLAGDVERATRVGNIQALAMMLYALSSAAHQARAFRV